MLTRCVFHVEDLCIWREPKLFHAECEQLKVIMVRTVSFGRARTAVSRPAEIVGDLGSYPLSAADRPRRRRNVEHAPVAEGAARRVRVADDEREALRALRRLA